MSAPDLSFRSNVSPFPVITSLTYAQSKIGSGNLPVLRGEESNPLLFRLYNNYLANSGISDAFNVSITTYDGAGAGSHTALTAAVSQSWVHILQNGFGQNSVPVPDVYTKYKGVDTPIGGPNKYLAQKGSDGVYTASRIRAVGGLGVGYIEYKTYATPASDAVENIYSFAITAIYEWVS